MRTSFTAFALTLSGCLFSSDSPAPTDAGGISDATASDAADASRPTDTSFGDDLGYADATLPDATLPDASRDMRAPRARFFLGYRESYPPLQPEENTCVKCPPGAGAVAEHQFLSMMEIVLQRTGTGFVTPFRLHDDWQTRWTQAADAARYEFDRGIFTGVNLGNDLFYHGLTGSDVTALADAAATSFPTADIWLTLESEVVTQQTQRDGSAVVGFAIPEKVTLVSVYAWHSALWDGTPGFVEGMKSMYEGYVFPRLGDRQRAILAPHTAAVPNNACDLACWDAALAAEAAEMGEWVRMDERVVGVAPWAWNTAGAANNVGMMELPLTRAAYVDVAASFSQ